MATAEKILLGYGVVSIGATPMGLTRGGSTFTIEREFREIAADGDFGPVGGRVVIDREVAKLTVNALEMFTAADMVKYYPGMAITPDNETTPTKNTMTSTGVIAAGDYVDVTWTGATKDGKALTIKITKAINMANLEWQLADKDEVVPSLEFTATYAEAARTTRPYSVDYAV